MNSKTVVRLQCELDPEQVGVKNARVADLASEGVRVPALLRVAVQCCCHRQP